MDYTTDYVTVAIVAVVVLIVVVGLRIHKRKK